MWRDLKNTWLMGFSMGIGICFAAFVYAALGFGLTLVVGVTVAVIAFAAGVAKSYEEHPE